MRPLHSAWWIAALIAAIGILFLSFPASTPEGGTSVPPSGSSPAPTLASKLRQLEERERKADATFWGPEVLARHHGAVVDDLWDRLNQSSNRLETLANWSLRQLSWQSAGPKEALRTGLTLLTGSGSLKTSTGPEWAAWLRQQAELGWHLNAVEFRQVGFEPPQEGSPPRSLYTFAAQADRSFQGTRTRAQWEGECWVRWQTNSALVPSPEPDSIEVLRWSSVQCDNPETFPLIFEAPLPIDPAHQTVDPLIVQDLDGDGAVEVLLPGANQLFLRTSEGAWTARALLSTPPRQVLGALVMDFDHDGRPDLLLATPEGLRVHQGTMGASFDEKPINLWTALTPLRGPVVLTAADIDRDGRLEVFLGQYRVPSLGQLFKPAYHNADDGYPSYLLRQREGGGFDDVTDAVITGLARHRRVFSASFVDVDADGAADLVVVSDFNGLDYYRNNRNGKLVNATADRGIETHAFGMAHAVSDFNNDGLADLLMIGMTSPTVSRLDQLGLWRPHPGLDPDRTLRTRMTAGNRLYAGRERAGLESQNTPASLARTGWSWGVAAADFDNDGWEDVYIANGNESNRSVREFEPLFWTHDLFIDRTVDDDAATAYLTTSYARTRGAGFSYAGYERNRLLLNEQGSGFVDIAGAFGLGLQTDCRNAVAADLDQDGRQDLILITEELWPSRRRSLRIYQNALSGRPHWIGVKFGRSSGGMDPQGTRVTLTAGGRKSVRVLLSGDSYRSQQPAALHWGLGTATSVDQLEVLWPDGTRQIVAHPGIDRSHVLTPPVTR